jgi:phospholipid/cholesterol/gamma-HCH transport system substrate-binding protein
MNSTREAVWVGLFVLVATTLLIATVFSIAGTFRRGNIPHRAYFKFAAGLEPGAAVRFGGMKAGSVRSLRVDPADSTRIEVDFDVAHEIPVKTDSVARITSLGPLGEHYLEITTGGARTSIATPGATLKSKETLSFDDLSDMIGELQPEAQVALQKLNQRLDELRVTVARANDLLSDRNRANISSALGTVNSMLADTRPKLALTLANVQSASARLTPVLDDLKKTMAQANDALAHIDAVVIENRKDLRQSVTELQQTLMTASAVMDRLDRTLEYNADSIDQTIENVRVTTRNLKELTTTLKHRPYTLIRADNPKERVPGER